MALSSKTLWVVDFTDITPIINTAVTIGASDLAIRTSSDLSLAIQPCHDNGIRLHGWRWPSAGRPQAMAEADRAATWLAAGMDGYIIDVEGAPGEPYDWDQPGLEQLATDFCAALVLAGAGTGKLLGLTSHYRAAAVFPKLPWAQFIASATVLLPQAYWHVAKGNVGTGNPIRNFDASVAAWKAIGGAESLIAPMAGELVHVTPQEVDDYCARVETTALKAGHFYVDTGGVADDVWAAIAAGGAPAE